MTSDQQSLGPNTQCLREQQKLAVNNLTLSALDPLDDIAAGLPAMHSESAAQIFLAQARLATEPTDRRTDHVPVSSSLRNVGFLVNACGRHVALNLLASYDHVGRHVAHFRISQIPQTACR